MKLKWIDVSYQSVGTAFKTINTDTTKGVEVYSSKVKIKKGEEVNGIKKSEELIVEEGNGFYIKNLDNPLKENVIEKLQIEEIAADPFIIWNKEQDKVQYVEEDLGILAETDQITPSINLSGSAVEEGFLVSWEVENLPELTTIKILLSEEEDFVFRNALEILEIDDSSEDMLIEKVGGKYFIKACVFSQNKCIVYSNVITAEFSVNDSSNENIEEEIGEITQPEEEIQIDLSMNEVSNGIELNWNIKPESIQDEIKGFKILYDEIEDESDIVSLKEITVTDIDIRQQVIYFVDSKINSFIRVCIIDTKNECYVESNILNFNQEEPQEELNISVSNENLRSVEDKSTAEE